MKASLLSFSFSSWSLHPNKIVSPLGDQYYLRSRNFKWSLITSMNPSIILMFGALKSAMLWNACPPVLPLRRAQCPGELRPLRPSLLACPSISRNSLVITYKKQWLWVNVRLHIGLHKKVDEPRHSPLYSQFVLATGCVSWRENFVKVTFGLKMQFAETEKWHQWKCSCMFEKEKSQFEWFCEWP